jgi:hypothetical protein
VVGDLARRHELDRRAERIAQRQAEIGGLGPRQDVGVHDAAVGAG